MIEHIEARYVGRTTIAVIDAIFHEQEISTARLTALVTRFGIIEKSVADVLKSNNYIVSIFDTRPYVVFDAFTLGYKTDSKHQLLNKADMRFSAIAKQSLDYEDIENCKNDAVLVSVGSRGSKFEFESIIENAKYAQ